MRMTGALLAIILNVNAAAEDRLAIIPHVEADGSITWIVTVDATTVKSFETNSPDDRNDTDNHLSNRPLAALNRWLDYRLSEVRWCSNGWYYRTEDPNYIEALSDGRLRVKGGCRKPPSAKPEE